MIKLDILSDPICPWCFIGKARLDRALEACPAPPFEIEWHPFRLNPDMPPGGMDRRIYLERKFGSRQAAAKAYAEIDRAARESGIEIDFAAIRRTPDTLDAHRLIHWAGIERCQGAVVDLLFRAYFLEGRDIGEKEVLEDIAARAGMAPEPIGRLLAGDADRQEILEREKRARAMGVRAVPTFIVGGRSVVPGARETAFWEEVIGELRSAQARNG